MTDFYIDKINPELEPNFVETIQGSISDPSDVAPTTPEDYLEYWTSKMHADHVEEFDAETGLKRHFVRTDNFEIEIFGLGEGN